MGQFFLHSSFSTLRIFYTPHFLHSSFSTLRIFYTPHFPHSAFSILLIFHTPHFPHSAFSTLLIFHTPHFLHSALRTPHSSYPTEPPPISDQCIELVDQFRHFEVVKRFTDTNCTQVVFSAIEKQYNCPETPMNSK